MDECPHEDCFAPKLRCHAGEKKPGLCNIWNEREYLQSPSDEPDSIEGRLRQVQRQLGRITTDVKAQCDGDLKEKTEYSFLLRAMNDIEDVLQSCE